MAINYKQLSTSVRQNVEQPKRVGSNYLERKQLTSNQPAFSESAKAPVSKDGFGARNSESADFASNAKYSSIKTKVPLHTMLENGHMSKAGQNQSTKKMTDEARIAICDSILSAPITSTVRAIPKTLMKSTARTTKTS